MYDQLPCVYPFENFPEISSIPDLGENEWEMRLYSEIDTLRLRTGESEPAAQPLPALPAKCPPWNRMRPVVQRAFRADGQRVRDGGGCLPHCSLTQRRFVQMAGQMFLEKFVMFCIGLL